MKKKSGFKTSSDNLLLFQHIIAFALLCLILVVSSGVLTRFHIASKLWLLIYAASAMFLLFDWKRFVESISHSWPVLLLPLFAFISTFWSEAPERSLFASIQLIISTLIAIWIGIQFSIKHIFIGIFLATALGLVASLLNNYLHFIDTSPATYYEGMEVVYTGIYDQKNMLGKAINLLSISLVILGIKYRMLALALVFTALLWFPLSWSQSAGSILVYLMTLTLPIFWWLSNNTKNLLVLFMVCLTLLLIAVFLVFVLNLDVINKLLDSVGKDSTLTGRTVLWSSGLNIFSNYPLTGVGYQAFWHLDGEFGGEVRYIRAMFSGLPINGFHNAYIEVLVALGLFGFSIFCFLLVSILVRSVNWFQKQCTPESFGVLFFVVSSIIAALFDVIIFRQHEIFYILMIAFYIALREQSFNEKPDMYEELL